MSATSLNLSITKEVLEKVLVLGSGNFGTCLADHLASLRHDVTIWCRTKEAADSINNDHKNLKYLKDVTLLPNISACCELTKEVVAAHNVILLSIPTQHMRSILTQIAPFITSEHLVVCVNKGIEISTRQLPSTIAKEVLGKEIGSCVVFLSGPSFAVEVVRRQVTCVTAASESLDHAHRCQHIFHAPYFRVYTSTDAVGVEVAGALKNVIAIAAGISFGLGVEQNGRAALITRGLYEITAVGMALGASAPTFLGLSGVGDLFLTCQSEKSRNFTVGMRLGRGESLQTIVDTLGSVAEGVKTAEAAYHLVQGLKLDLPIITMMYRMLFEGVGIKEGAVNLLNLEARHEFTGIVD
eukprot:CAMPEP_0177648136 /NCGR_PEP_ID=MMETSP0447-20121125/10670_1 /TAXON_ID=0 /ORGANISM="Stygamoeba regulata, Strain BSH-02190019" /LENGTH=353 /DNA_ID=CAMNT_0019150763 /DNA_START=57 /DNA_END=1118 /DNA_ORIENTATION=+